MSSASRGACAGPRDGTCRLGKIKQVSAFRLVEPECFGERVKHLWGGTADYAAFELGVVLHAHPGQGGEKAPSYAELDESTKQRIRTPGTSGEAVDPVHGKYSWYSIEVAHPDETGAIALVYFHRDAEDRLNTELLVLLAIAVAVLIAVGVVAYWASGRILGHTTRFAEEANKALHSPNLRLPEEGTEEYEALAKSANKLLDKADEKLDDEKRFNEDITFALRTPLAMIQGGLEGPGQTGEWSKGDSGKLLGEIQHLRDMVDNLAVIALVSRGDYIGQSVAMDSTMIAHDAVIDWRERMEERELPVVIELDASPKGTHVVVDQARLRQAVDEIIENAVDAVLHAPDKPAENNVITVRTAFHSDGHERRVALEVIDRGRGIPEEDFSVVQKRFGRASNDPHPSGGLGLAVAKNIVAAMRGQIEIRNNQPGPGVTVAISLPYVEDPNEEVGSE